MARMVDYVRSGNIGEIISIDSSFTFPASLEGNYRISEGMGGGALFDVGVYQIHAAIALLGDNALPNIESCDVKVGETGVDLTTKWRINFNDSISTSGLASFEMPEAQSLTVHGEKNLVELLGEQVFTSWRSPSLLKLGEQIEEFVAVDPYMLMIENFSKKVRGEDGWVIPLETSLSVLKIVDQLIAHK